MLARRALFFLHLAILRFSSARAMKRALPALCGGRTGGGGSMGGVEALSCSVVCKMPIEFRIRDARCLLVSYIPTEISRAVHTNCCSVQQTVDRQPNFRVDQRAVFWERFLQSSFQTAA